jgi:hypothetical protein
MLPIIYTNLSSSLLSILTSYEEGISGHDQCEFRSNNSTTDHIDSIRHILKKKSEYNRTVHQLFIDFQKA